MGAKYALMVPIIHHRPQSARGFDKRVKKCDANPGNHGTFAERLAILGQKVL
jgi:hypothetical protein